MTDEEKHRWCTQVMTDEEKHRWCIKRTGYPAVFLPPSLYEASEKQGIDMRYYVKIAAMLK